MILNEYFLLRCCNTGITEYQVLSGNRRIGEVVSHTLPSFPVDIIGENLLLSSERDLDMTIFPGCSQKLMDRDGRHLYGKVIYREAGKHEIQFGGASYMVHSAGTEHRFFLNGAPIAITTKASEHWRGFISLGEEWELQSVMTAVGSIPDDIALLLMCFPFIRVAM